ncbi:pantetheine-phosphate adenylyltransferase [Frankia sp. AgKG'84/4]|uniref:pantetheine-phosphate adenylyltransferase n=1 Tax=Frankia sp. AgKG'84/4 TaxID=573490 RepID=UPI00200EC263|nr:pantetheine-phosphate adenylyltransferase [Frankia sp. AgKG'84/4]MCL9796937.1 pantetheine-phosphate adenylyltransferase [Frankia sp. AgKG'84/4]
MRRAVCPGSFDPVTVGHVDIIERAAALTDDLVVTVLPNAAKRCLFELDERVEMLTSTTAHLANVRVATFDGLLADFCLRNGITAIVRSLRSVSDFEYELQIAQMTRRLSEVETLFIAACPEYSFLSSSLVKDVASHAGDVTHLVPPQVRDRLREKYRSPASR